MVIFTKIFFQTPHHHYSPVFQWILGSKIRQPSWQPPCTWQKCGFPILCNIREIDHFIRQWCAIALFSGPRYRVFQPSWPCVVLAEPLLTIQRLFTFQPRCFLSRYHIDFIQSKIINDQVVRWSLSIVKFNVTYSHEDILNLLLLHYFSFLNLHLSHSAKLVNNVLCDGLNVWIVECNDV